MSHGLRAALEAADETFETGAPEGPLVDAPAPAPDGATLPGLDDTDHPLFARIGGPILWACPNCWHVNHQTLVWTRPWARCRGCARNVRFGVGLSQTPRPAWAVEGVPGTTARMNRRVPPPSGMETFAQFDGYVVWRCDCGKVTKAYPGMPQHNITCQSCKATRYLWVLVWYACRSWKKQLADDWIFRARDVLFDPRYAESPHVRCRWTTPVRRRHHPDRVRGLNRPIIIGRPLKGESRAAYLARLAAARGTVAHGGKR